jgi:hypothetical protein
VRTLRATSLRHALALGMIVALFWASRLVIPGHLEGMFAGDLRLYHYPTYETFFRLLARGELPRWNPYQLCGLPWLGPPTGGFFYPPHLLHLILPTHAALAASSLLHLVLIALTTALFVRRAGLGAPPAALAALLFALRGTVRAWVLLPSILEAAAWLPLGCLAVLRLSHERSARAAGLLAVTTAASWLAGGLQATVYLFYAWAALLVALLAGDRSPARQRLASAMLFAAALGLGSLAAAVQLAPSLEMAGEGTRAGRLDESHLYPFPNPGFGLLHLAVAGHQVSFGIVGLSLVPAALLATRHRLLGWWAAGLGSAALVLALGPVTPLFEAYFLLPFLAWFRLPSRLLLLTDLCFAVLAAVALDTILDRCGTPAGHVRAPLRRLRRWAPLAGALAIIALHPGGRPAVLAATTLFLLALLVPSWQGRRVAAWALVALAALELFLAPPNTSRLPYDRAAAAAYRTHAGVYEQLAAAQGSGRVWLLHPWVPATAWAPRLATRYRVRSLDDYESVTLRRQADYYTYLLEGRIRPGRTNLVFAGMLTSPLATSGLGSLPTRHRLLDLAAVRLLLAPAAMASRPDVRALVQHAGLTPLPAPHPEVVLFENPSALPRAYVVYRAEPAPEAGVLLARLSAPSFDPLATSFVEGPPLLPPSSGDAPRGHGATIVRDEAEVVEIEATLEAPGLLVLADSFYPEWRATVDGVDAPIFATNHLFRGVPVPAGAHRVRFTYRPASLVAGAAASLAGALGIGVLLVRRPRRYSA